MRVTCMRIRIQLFTGMGKMRIRIPLLMKVMRICDYLSTDPPGSIISLHTSISNVQGPPRLHFESLKLSKFDFIADPGRAFYSMLIWICTLVLRIILYEVETCVYSGLLNSRAFINAGTHSMVNWDHGYGTVLVRYYLPLCRYAVLRIQDVYPGSESFPSRISDPNFFHPGSSSKNLSILTTKMVSKLSEILCGLFIPDPDFYPSWIPGPGSRGQKGTGSRIRIRKHCRYGVPHSLWY
jgi:hypothetical protein